MVVVNLLLDDHLFRLWKEEICARDEVLAKANDIGELANKIDNEQKGLLEEKEEIEV